MLYRKVVILIVNKIDIVICQFCVLEMGEFQKICGTFITLIDDVSTEVEKEKMMVRHCSYIFSFM